MVKPRKPVNLDIELWRTLQEIKLKDDYKTLSEVIRGLLVNQNKRTMNNE